MLTEAINCPTSPMDNYWFLWVFHQLVTYEAFKWSTAWRKNTQRGGVLWFIHLAFFTVWNQDPESPTLTAWGPVYSVPIGCMKEWNLGAWIRERYIGKSWMLRGAAWGAWATYKWKLQYGHSQHWAIAEKESEWLLFSHSWNEWSQILVLVTHFCHLLEWNDDFFI